MQMSVTLQFLEFERWNIQYIIRNSKLYTHRHTHTYTHTHTYLCICLCACVHDSFRKDLRPYFSIQNQLSDILIDNPYHQVDLYYLKWPKKKINK